MQNHYATLGLNSSATAEEIRRAYRILARRYHPDVNPGRSSEEIFKKISEAYSVLSDPEKKRGYDIDLETDTRRTGFAADRAFRKAASAAMHEAARKRFQKQQTQTSKEAESNNPSNKKTAQHETQEKAKKEGIVSRFTSGFKNKLFGSIQKKSSKQRVNKVLVVEISLSMRDAIFGIKKAIEIVDGDSPRKISIKVPPGTRNGNIVHLRSTKGEGEEIFIIARVANHNFLSISQKGLIVEVPITVGEAVNGASISVPTLEDPITIKIPPGSQSGSEIRVKERGIHLKDRTRGDLFYRLQIKIPESSDAIGLKERCVELDSYYGTQVRHSLPQSLV